MTGLGFVPPHTPGIPQPRVGITGTDRSEDFRLALTEDGLRWRAMALAMMQVQHSALLVGNPAPIVAEMYERMKHPRVGDLVAETTARHVKRGHNDDAVIRGFGILLTHRNEWAESDDDWAASLVEEAADLASERLVDHFWYIQYGPNPDDVCRWSNCEFYTVLTNPADFER